MKSFRSLIEDIASVVEGTVTSAQIVEPQIDWDGVVLEDANSTDEWTPADSLIYINGLIESAIVGGMSEDDAVECVTYMLDEAYKWSYGVQDDEKNVTGDIGTVDQPSSASVPSGAAGRKVNASGLPNSYEEWRRVVLATLSKKPPKPILEFPMEIAVETWNAALGIALNKGIGIDFQVDKKTGANLPIPAYGQIYRIWSDMLNKQYDINITHHGEKKLKHALDADAKVKAKELSSSSMGRKEKARASAVLRGRQGKMNPNAA